MKKSISALTKASETKLADALTMDDLRTMAYLVSDVVKGNVTVEQYREKEQDMIKKYNFKGK